MQNVPKKRGRPAKAPAAGQKIPNTQSKPVISQLQAPASFNNDINSFYHQNITPEVIQINDSYTSPEKVLKQKIEDDNEVITLKKIISEAPKPKVVREFIRYNCSVIENDDEERLFNI
jgi:hypothetical protein